MNEPQIEPAHERLEFPCTSCGARLEFDPGTAHMRCPYCESEQEIERLEEPIVEHDFERALIDMPGRPASEVMQGQQVRCKGCGAVQSVVDQSSHCAFCDAPVVIEEDDPEVIVPESLLPFGVDDEQARQAFKAWLATRWFAPRDLGKRARGAGMDGLYLPYWTYDTHTVTRYTGQRGEHYYETQYYTDSNGNRRSRRVRKTRWYAASGVVNDPFDDVLICASRSLPNELVRKLEPWDLDALHTYEPRYLSGFRTERYGVDLDEGFEVAKDRMQPTIRSTIRRDIGGDTQRISTMSTSYNDKTFKHLLLPLWISSFRYGDKVYRVLVNARTGEVQGERPWSILKIIGAIVLLAGLIAGGIWLARERGAFSSNGYDAHEERAIDGRVEIVPPAGW